MSENRSDSSLQSYTNSSNCSNVTLSAAVVTAILSPVAVVGNALPGSGGTLEEPLPENSFLHSARWTGLNWLWYWTHHPTFYVVNELIVLELIDIKLTLKRIIINVITHSCAAFFFLHNDVDHNTHVRWTMVTYDSSIFANCEANLRTYFSTNSPFYSVGGQSCHYSAKENWVRPHSVHCIFDFLPYRHLNCLLQTVSNNSSSPATNSDERSVLRF